MNWILHFAFHFTFYLLHFSLSAQPRQYQVRKTADPITIDGKPDRAWKKADWSAPFVDIEGDKHPAPALRTRVKMLYDQQFLYILAELEEPHLWATLHQRDAIIYRDHDFEVFLDPQNDQHQYFEYEINALGTVMDLFMSKPYKKGGRADLKWNSAGLKSAVHIKGTLNQPADTDTGWTVELAIPFQDLERTGRPARPSPGTHWRINFSRVEWTLDTNGSTYTKRPGPNGKPIPEHNWVWSPQGVIDMHVPENWGVLEFVK